MNKKAEIITFTAKISWEVWQCRTDLILTILTSVNEELWAGVLLCRGINQSSCGIEVAAWSS